MAEYYMPRFGVDEEVKFTFFNEQKTGFVTDVSKWHHGGFMYTVEVNGTPYLLFDQVENIVVPSPLNLQSVHEEEYESIEVYR